MLITYKYSNILLKKYPIFIILVEISYIYYTVLIIKNNVVMKKSINEIIQNL